MSGQRAVFERCDLENAWSKAWQDRLGDYVEGQHENLIADPVGTRGPKVPHPVVAFYPIRYRPFLESTGSTRFTALCTRAKIFFALGNGTAESVWGTVPKPDEPTMCRFVVGIWIERSPFVPASIVDPDRNAPPYDGKRWDWNELQSRKLNDAGW